MNDYCPCGSSDGRPFRCMCIGNYYGDELDGGLGREEAWEFLGSMPQNERNRLWALVKSFGNDAQRLHGMTGRDV